MRKLFISISVLCVALAAAAISAAAEENSVNTVAFALGAEEKNPASLAMAGSDFASNSSLAWGAMRNPAAMSFSESAFGFAASYSSWNPKLTATQYFNGGVGFKFGNFSISAAGSYLPGIKYPISDTKDFTPADIYAALGAGLKIGENWSVGVNARYFTTTLAPKYSYSGFGGSLMAAYKTDNLSVSAGAENIGTSVTSKSGHKFSLPSAAVAGGTYLSKFGDLGLDACATAKYYFCGGISAAGGVSLDYKEMVFVRAGYRFCSEKAPLASCLSLGAGFKFAGVSVNAAYLATGNVAGSMVFGLELAF